MLYVYEIIADQANEKKLVIQEYEKIAYDA